MYVTAGAPHSSVISTMLVSSPDDPMSIFVNGKLKPGTYKVQNLSGKTYLEILEDSKELCCRPASVLSDRDALVSSEIYWAKLWDISLIFITPHAVGFSSVGVWIQD